MTQQFGIGVLLLATTLSGCAEELDSNSIGETPGAGEGRAESSPEGDNSAGSVGFPEQGRADVQPGDSIERGEGADDQSDAATGEGEGVPSGNDDTEVDGQSPVDSETGVNLSDGSVLEEDDSQEPDLGQQASCGVGTFDLPEQSGVVYSAHFYSNELRWYRVDGEYPIQEGALSTGGYAHDTALDPLRDLLVIAHDIEKSVEVFSLTRPSEKGTPVDAPLLKAVVATGEYSPRVVAVDVIRGRLFVAANLPVEEGTLESMWLLVYDLETDTPEPLIEPYEIPVTVTMDVEPYAGVLGLVDLNGDTLNLYSILETLPTALPGPPVNLRNLYPQSNSTGFQVRGLRFDPKNGRILAARAQSALSEVIALSYPAVFGSEEECPEQFTNSDLQVIVDGFDVDQNPSDWNNLLGAYSVLPVSGTGEAMFVANAWNGTMSSAAVFPLDDTLTPQKGCGDYAGTGCFYQPFVGGTPIGYAQTDGAACLDEKHRVVVGTSFDPANEGELGSLHLFQYEESFSMTKWPTQQGGSPSTAGLSIGLECH